MIAFRLTFRFLFSRLADVDSSGLSPLLNQTFTSLNIIPLQPNRTSFHRKSETIGGKFPSARYHRGQQEEVGFPGSQTVAQPSSRHPKKQNDVSVTQTANS